MFIPAYLLYELVLGMVARQAKERVKETRRETDTNDDDYLLPTASKSVCVGGSQTYEEEEEKLRLSNLSFL